MPFVNVHSNIALLFKLQNLLIFFVFQRLLYPEMKSFLCCNHSLVQCDGCMGEFCHTVWNAKCRSLFSSHIYVHSSVFYIYLYIMNISPMAQITRYHSNENTQQLVKIFYSGVFKNSQILIMHSCCVQSFTCNISVLFSIKAPKIVSSISFFSCASCSFHNSCPPVLSRLNNSRAFFLHVLCFSFNCIGSIPCFPWQYSLNK